MVGGEPHLPYNRARLFSSLFSKKPAPVTKLLHLREEWYRKQKVELRLNTRVVHLNLERRLAVLDSGQTIEFGKACLAMGSRPARPDAAGMRLGNVLYLRSFQNLEALREMAVTEKSVVVIGSGVLAAEAASWLSAFGCEVTLMSRSRNLWQDRLDAITSEWLTEQFRLRGIQMMMGEVLNGFEGKTILKNVQTKSGRRFPVSLAVMAIGAEPNLELVLNTPLGSPSGIPVNEHLETDRPGIYAVGDVALYPDRILGGVRRVDHWEAAVEQGRIAGVNITGKKRLRYEAVPYYSSRFFDLNLEMVGDFSRPPSRSECVEGALTKRKFVLHYYCGNVLCGIVLCNMDPCRAVRARKDLRDSRRL